jgi:integrase
MARSLNRLSARRVSTEKRQGLHADGGGLYLQVSRWGTKSWLFRFTLKGRSRQMGLGSLDTVSLSEARQKAERCRKLLQDGRDPIEARDANRAQRAATANTTFQGLAERFIAAHEAGWRNPKHRQQWRNTLATYAYPVLGERSVNKINTDMVLEVLQPIWTAKPETAMRLRQRIEKVLDYAKARELREGENPARWRGHLENLLPERRKVAAVKHHAALPWPKMPAFMAELRTREGVAARGLEFTILTAARTNEVMGANWEEIDLAERVWTVPADRIKARREHRVPLSPPAMEILEEMRAFGADGYVFPGQRRGQPLSSMAFLQLLRRMKRDDLTAHGFRSTFRTWASEATGYPHEVCEAALAHAISNAVERAYRRGDLFRKRRQMMDDWANFCAQPAPKTEGEIIPLRQKDA